MARKAWQSRQQPSPSTLGKPCTADGQGRTRRVQVAQGALCSTQGIRLQFMVLTGKSCLHRFLLSMWADVISPHRLGTHALCHMLSSCNTQCDKNLHAANCTLLSEMYLTKPKHFPAWKKGCPNSVNSPRVGLIMQEDNRFLVNASEDYLGLPSSLRPAMPTDHPWPADNFTCKTVLESLSARKQPDYSSGTEEKHHTRVGKRAKLQ